MSSHVLICRDSRGGPAPNGVAAPLGWREFTLADNPRFFRKTGVVGQINQLVANAAVDVIASGRNLTVVWGGPADLWAAPADELEIEFRKLRPGTLICPERPNKTDRWIISDWAGKPESMPAAAIQGAVSSTVATRYPLWRHGIEWRCSALLVRHHTSAEELGIVEPKKLTPDDVVNLVAMDPDVLEANRRADPSAPSGLRDLVAARLRAQADAGIAPENRAPIYSSEVDSILIPIVTRVGKGDGPVFLAFLRRDLRRAYADMSDVVLSFCLKTYQPSGPGIEALREAARSTATPASAA
jgi:hypothetical protein